MTDEKGRAPASPDAQNVTQRNMANAIRALSMDAVQAANSGHPGMPMGMADVATVLFTKFLKFDASAPNWPDRDRFVLSAGHGSMLLYSLLHLTGYLSVGIDQLRNFRKLTSHAAGHPEHGAFPGIETTTGPLGQGLATAVGMAIAERKLAAEFGDDIVDHYTYALAGDGCLMEGISQEAISLAGHLKLSRLIILFDDNQISIDGPTSLSTGDDHIKRFQASGWNTISADGHDEDAITEAINGAKNSDRPTLIALRTIIGFGSPNKQGTSATHGAALGEDEVAATRAELDWPFEPFVIPDDIAAAWKATGVAGRLLRSGWEMNLAALSPAKNAEWNRRQNGEISEAWAKAFSELKSSWIKDAPKVATRKSSQDTLEVLNAALPETIGGSADLTGSNNTKTDVMDPFTAGDYSGRYMYYGIREHAMAAAMNGIALHGGLIPYGGTFLIFSDYLRPALRLSAMMEQRVIYVLTHDSIGLGEDGPTHQPVEHLASLRAIPNLCVFRPADAVEAAECWDAAIHLSNRPSILALTRQVLPTVRTEDGTENLSAKGGYELAAADGDAVVTILATGSEVEIALAARDQLQMKSTATRVVSMPCWELFDDQDAAYREQTLGPGTVRIAVEAALEQGWSRYTGDADAFVGMTGFGASAPAADLFKHFGITAEAVAAKALALLAKRA